MLAGGLSYAAEPFGGATFRAGALLGACVHLHPNVALARRSIGRPSSLPAAASDPTAYVGGGRGPSNPSRVPPAVWGRYNTPQIRRVRRPDVASARGAADG